MYSIKKDNWVPAAKTLIKYNNSNNFDKNDDKEKERIDIEFTEQNSDSKMIKIY